MEDNVEMIKSKIDSVNQLMSKIGQEMYKQGGGTSGENPNPGDNTNQNPNDNPNDGGTPN